MENTIPPTQTPTQPAASGEDKTVAIVSYLTIVGFIVAIILHSSKKTRLGAYHLRQVLGLVITGFALGVGCFIIGMIPVVNLVLLLVWPVVGIAFLVFWIMGIIAAVNGEMKPMPIVGPLYQQWLGTTFE